MPVPSAEKDGRRGLRVVSVCDLNARYGMLVSGMAEQVARPIREKSTSQARRPKRYVSTGHREACTGMPASVPDIA
eukprot:3940877-Rhodomonas_salina.7